MTRCRLSGPKSLPYRDRGTPRSSPPGERSGPERFTFVQGTVCHPPGEARPRLHCGHRESRKRTLEHITLPPGESFAVEYVKGKTWSGYNVRSGSAHSFLQVNTDFPITIDRAVDLGVTRDTRHQRLQFAPRSEFVRKARWEEFPCTHYSAAVTHRGGNRHFGIDMAFRGTSYPI